MYIKPPKYPFIEPKLKVESNQKQTTIQKIVTQQNQLGPYYPEQKQLDPYYPEQKQLYPYYPEQKQLYPQYPIQNQLLLSPQQNQLYPQPYQDPNQKVESDQKKFTQQNQIYPQYADQYKTKQLEVKHEEKKEQKIPNDQNFKCAFLNHQLPVLMVVLDPKLKKHERLLCSQCIIELEQNKRTIGLNKAIGMAQENYKKKKEQREIVVDQNYKELEELKNNLIQLKSFLNKNLDQMLEITKMWMTDLESYRIIEYNFDNEIQQLIDGQLQFEIEQMVDEIKPLNMKWIPKLNQALPQFSSFKEYSICQNILNNLSQEKKLQINQEIPSPIPAIPNQEYEESISFSFQQQHQIFQSYRSNQKKT